MARGILGIYYLPFHSRPHHKEASQRCNDTALVCLWWHAYGECGRWTGGATRLTCPRLHCEGVLEECNVDIRDLHNRHTTLIDDYPTIDSATHHRSALYSLFCIS
jgi:hypothetical protein